MTVPTIVLGGLMDDDVQESGSKVPVLGDIPFLGRLFRSEKATVVRRNLMVFIRPSIIRDQEAMQTISASKYGYIRAQQMLSDNQSIRLFPGKQRSGAARVDRYGTVRP